MNVAQVGPAQPSPVLARFSEPFVAADFRAEAGIRRDGKRGSDGRRVGLARRQRAYAVVLAAGAGGG